LAVPPLVITGGATTKAGNPIMTTCQPSDGEIENWLLYDPGDDTFSKTAVR
jgi:hypothetical protein